MFHKSACVGLALTYLAIGDLGKAEITANQALKIEGDKIGIYQLLGIIFQNKKDIDKAVLYYKQELAINPKALSSLINLGHIYIQQGRPEDAIGVLVTASDIKESDQCLLLMAQAYQIQNRFKEAANKYKKIDLGRTSNKLVPYNLGLCLLKLGQRKLAIDAFKSAIEMDANFAIAWLNLGNSLRKEGNYQESLVATQRVLEIDPNNPDAFYEHGMTHKSMGNLNQAVTSYNRSLEINPDNDAALIALVSIYIDLGKYDNALTESHKLVALKPEDPKNHLLLSITYRKFGDIHKSLLSAIKTVELNPDDPDSHLNLGSIYRDLGKLDQALESTLNSDHT